MSLSDVISREVLPDYTRTAEDPAPVGGSL